MNKTANQAMTYEVVGNTRTKHVGVKQGQRKALHNMSDWVLVSGVSRELYRRHSVSLWAVLAIVTWVGIVWSKLS